MNSDCLTESILDNGSLCQGKDNRRISVPDCNFYKYYKDGKIFSCRNNIGFKEFKRKGQCRAQARAKGKDDGRKEPKCDTELMMQIQNLKKNHPTKTWPDIWAMATNTPPTRATRRATTIRRATPIRRATATQRASPTRRATATRRETATGRATARGRASPTRRAKATRASPTRRATGRASPTRRATGRASPTRTGTGRLQSVVGSIAQQIGNLAPLPVVAEANRRSPTRNLAPHQFSSENRRSPPRNLAPLPVVAEANRRSPPRNLAPHQFSSANRRSPPRNLPPHQFSSANRRSPTRNLSIPQFRREPSEQEFDINRGF